MKKMQVVSSYFWPYINTNGHVITKDTLKLEKHYDIKVLTYDCTGKLNVDEHLKDKVAHMNIDSDVHISSFFIKRFYKQYKKIVQNQKAGYETMLSYHHLFETSIACTLAKLRLGKKIKWVAKISDPPYFMSPFMEDNDWKTYLKLILPSYVYYWCINTFADSIVFNDEYQAEFFLKKKYNKSKKYIINQMGFSEHANIENVDARTENHNHVRIGIFGNLYGRRSAREFFDVLNKTEMKADFPNVHVDIYGNIWSPDTIAYYDKLVEDDTRISIKGVVSYEESVRLMKEYDILLLVDGNFGNDFLYPYTPSKIIDYLAAHKPILAISSNKSPVYDICRETGNWFSDFEELNIEATFKQCMKAYKEYQPNMEVLAQYNSDALIAKLVEEIEKI